MGSTSFCLYLMSERGSCFCETSSSDNNETNSKARERDEQLYREVFNMFDHDPQDGEITAQELLITMTNLGLDMTLPEAKDIINEMDHDQNQRIDFREFCEMMSRHHHHCFNQTCKEGLIDDLRRAFHLFDEDKNGYICKDELRQILVKTGEHDISEAEIDEILKSADTDSNGMICFDEFVAMMTLKH